MSVLFQSPDLQLPWSSSQRENKRFNLIVIIALIIAFAIGFLIQSQERPVIDIEAKKIPDSLVKVMARKKKEKPKPKPVVKKKEEKKKEEPKKEKPKPKPEKPKTEKQKKAQEQAKKELDKSKKALDALASLKINTKASKNLSQGNKQAVVNRKVLTGGAATATSGGIQTAAVPTSSNLGGELGSRAVLAVSDGSLGGSRVDTSGSVAQATQSEQRSGQRSEERIRRVLDSAKGQLYGIYNRALRKNPTLQGRVTFELVIQPNGRVSDCKVVSSALNDSGLERRLIAKMKQLDFGAEDVAVLKTRWAIDFLPN